MSELKLISPQVNMNGTSSDELLDQYLEITTKIAELQHVMRKATPHGRDYQTLQNCTQQARDAFNERYNALTDMWLEFNEITMNIHAQREAK